jgi:hypothetical protein
MMAAELCVYSSAFLFTPAIPFITAAKRVKSSFHSTSTTLVISEILFIWACSLDVQIGEFRLWRYNFTKHRSMKQLLLGQEQLLLGQGTSFQRR